MLTLRSLLVQYGLIVIAVLCKNAMFMLAQQKYRLVIYMMADFMCLAQYTVNILYVQNHTNSCFL